MIINILEYISGKIVEKNRFLDKLCPVAFKLPSGEIVGFTTETEPEYVGFDDRYIRAGYIRVNPVISSTNASRQFTSSKRQKQNTVDCTLVIYSFTEGRFNSMILGEKIRDDLQSINFSLYQGNENSIKINVKRTNTDGLQVFQNETGKKFEGGNSFSSASIQFDLVYETSEERCLEDCNVFDKYFNCAITPTQEESLCLPVKIYRNGELIETVPSGGEFSFTTDPGQVIIYFSNGSSIVATITAPGTYTIAKHSIFYSDGITPVVQQEFNQNYTIPKHTITNTNNDVLFNDEFDVNRQIPDVIVKNTAGTPQTPAVVGNEYIIPDNIASNSDASTIIPIIQGVPAAIPDVTITQKNSNNTTIGSDVVPGAKNVNVNVVNTPIRNTALTVLTNAPSGEPYTVPDDSVTNSDASVIVNNVAQGVTKILSDITVTQPNGSTASYPSMKNFACTLISALATQDLNDDLTISQRDVLQIIKPIKSGQTTSYRADDDGDYERGRLVNFTTLANNNPFGNTNRFTDTLGTQVYANTIMVDWATGLMWRRAILGGAGENWNTQIDGQPYTLGSYSDWTIPNINEINSILSHENSNVINSALGILSSSFVNGIIFTSTTSPANSAQAKVISGAGVGTTAKTTTGSRLCCRYFSLAELGL